MVTTTLGGAEGPDWSRRLEHLDNIICNQRSEDLASPDEILLYTFSSVPLPSAPDSLFLRYNGTRFSVCPVTGLVH